MAMTGTSERLGELLVANGIITPFQLESALQEQQLSGEFLGRVLVRMGMSEEQDIVDALAEQAGLERVDLKSFTIKEDVLHEVPPHIATFYNVIPFRKNEETKELTLAMADPLNVNIVDELHSLLGEKWHVVGAVSTFTEINEAIQSNYAHGTASISGILDGLAHDFEDMEEQMADKLQRHEIADPENLSAMAQLPEVIKLVQLVLLRAVESRASDVHIEPYEDICRVRVRIDGKLEDIIHPPLELGAAIVSRVKVMAGLDIAERRLPQDGRIMLSVGMNEMDIRVSCLPISHGESVVMRLLDKSVAKLTVDSIGFDPETLKRVEWAIRQPTGIFLVTGPTGSGKTSTLYACLGELNTPEVKIITTEDPVEYQVEGLLQIQIHEEVGLTFARALRSLIRQDPDILLVGEVRDSETARIVIQEALTGHLVFSTLHTNDAPTAVTRLIDMGIEPFLITSVIRAIMAQRLVRLLCGVCKESVELTEEQMRILQLSDEDLEGKTIHGPVGCENCEERGYRGRTGIFEMMIVTEDMRELIYNGTTAAEIRKLACKEGMLTLREAGLLRMFNGETSAEEIINITQAYM